MDPCERDRFDNIVVGTQKFEEDLKKKNLLFCTPLSCKCTLSVLEISDMNKYKSLICIILIIDI